MLDGESDALSKLGDPELACEVNARLLCKLGEPVGPANDGFEVVERDLVGLLDVDERCLEGLLVKEGVVRDLEGLV